MRNMLILMQMNKKDMKKVKSILRFEQCIDNLFLNGSL